MQLPVPLSAHNAIIAQFEARLAEKNELVAELRAERDRYRQLWIEERGKTWQTAPSVEPSIPLSEPIDEPTGVNKMLWGADDHEWFAQWSANEMEQGARPEDLEERWMKYAGTMTPVEAMTAV